MKSRRFTFSNEQATGNVNNTLKFIANLSIFIRVRKWIDKQRDTRTGCRIKYTKLLKYAGKSLLKCCYDVIIKNSF